jgi:AcrR family transcriptional regulator
MSVDAPGTERTVHERLLDAALEVAADHGLSRLSVGDVAKRAGLSRQTLYKHFASKDDLVSQTVIREAGRIVEAVIEAADDEEDPLRSLELAIIAALDLVRGHPLLDRLVATEPETLLPLLVDGQGSVLGSVQLVCRQMIASRFPELSERQSAAGADLLSRMLVSYAVRPPDLEADAVARSLSYAVVAAILTPSMPIPSSSPATS